MESDKEVLSKIVSERVDKIQSEAIENIKHIQEHSKKELSYILPDLMKQIESVTAFKFLDGLKIIQNGGVIKTGEHENPWDNTRWQLTIADQIVFYEEGRSHGMLDKGRYRITLIMEKVDETAEG